MLKLSVHILNCLTLVWNENADKKDKSCFQMKNFITSVARFSLLQRRPLIVLFPPTKHKSDEKVFFLFFTFSTN